MIAPVEYTRVREKILFRHAFLRYEIHFTVRKDTNGGYL